MQAVVHDCIFNCELLHKNIQNSFNSTDRKFSGQMISIYQDLSKILNQNFQKFKHESLRVKRKVAVTNQNAPYKYIYETILLRRIKMVERINKLSSRRITLLPMKSKFITKEPSSLTISISTIKKFSFVHPWKNVKKKKKKQATESKGKWTF